MDRIEPLQDASGCRRCGDRFPYESARFAGGWAEGLCAGCRIELPAFERAVAFASYERETREMLHLLKFSGMEPVAQAVLAPGMAAAIRKLQAEAAASVVVVPVPLYRARLRRRGFNQSLLLARAAVEVLRRECRAWELTLAPGVLERIKDTHELYPLAPHQRRAGLRGAFRVADAEAVRGREVLLVDDILTTGATARECARVLRRAGAAKIWVATYARTLDEPAWQTARWTASNELAEGQRDASSASQQRNLNHF
jgi:ComF family protein